MAETLTIRTASSTEVIKIAVPGPQGAAGQGVPVGGSTGQVLRKASGSDYDTEWAAAGSGSGSVTSVALASTDLTISGSPITDSGTITANIAANAVTLEKLQTISSEHLLGRHGSGNGGVQTIGLGTGLAISGSNVRVATTGITAGTYTKLTIDETGRATVGATATPSDIGAQSLFETQNLTLTTDTELTANRAKQYNVIRLNSLTITLPTTGHLTGDIVVIYNIPAGSGTLTIRRGGASESFWTLTAAEQLRWRATGTGASDWELVRVDSHSADRITSGSFGNISHDGKLGSTAGLPVVTTTAGAVTTLALGTANQILRVNSGASGVEFADPAASGVTGAAASASDVLGVSGANITGVDANADRLVMYDDSASKLTHATAGKGLSFDGTTLNSAPAFPVDPISRGATFISYLGHELIGNSSNAVNTSGGFLLFSLVYVPKSANYTTFTCIVSVAGSASSLGKMALYTIKAADALPGALVCESGTFAADTTGIKQPTMASTFVSEGWYYMAIGTNSTTNMNFTGDVMTSLRGKFAGSAGAAPVLLDFSQKLYADLWPNPWNGTGSTFRNAYHPITSLT